MLIVLPFPDSRLLPNHKLDRWTKAEATREARYASKMMSADYLNQQEITWRHDPARFYYEFPKDECRLSITWYPPTRKVADWDSMARATKPIIDGLVDAGILAGDGWDVIKGVCVQLGPPDKANPRTEIEIVER